MNTLSYDSLTRSLLDAIPEIRDVYQQKAKFSGEEFGPHVVYGDVLTEGLVLPLLSSSRPNETLLRKVFKFLECLAGDDNPMIRDVVRVTVLERIGDNPESLSRAKEYMGAATRALSNDIEKFWGRL